MTQTRPTAPSLLLLLALAAPSTLLPFPGGFTDRTIDDGVHYIQLSQNRPDDPETTVLTGGAAAGDYDGDGWPDLFVTRYDNTDILFRNRGAVRQPGEPYFEDVTEQAGVGGDVLPTNGAAWGDIDNDGDLDLYVTSIGTHRFRLYVNNGDGTFTEEAVQRNAHSPSSLPQKGFSVVFGDYDRDGWLDIHTNEWEFEKLNQPEVKNHAILLRNRGAEKPGHFVNATAKAGVELGSEFVLYAFTSSFADMDGDGWPDLLVAGDYTTAQLFWNNGDGTFTEGTETAMINEATNPMGSAIADFDQDGLLDWFVTSINDNRLYRNLGDRTFEEIATEKGVNDGQWGWGAAFFDYDNDGDHDLIMTNGWRTPGNPRQGDPRDDPMHLWRNDFGDFVEVSNFLGIRDTREGKGLLTFDYDRDGDLDVFVVNNLSSPVLYRNDVDSGNSWLQVRLRGVRSNTRGIGTRIYLMNTPTSPERLYELSGANHYLGQSDAIVQIGFGLQAEPAHSLRLVWPSGIEQTLRDVPLNQFLAITEDSSYLDWLALRFSAEEMDNPQLTAEEADPDGDGLPNATEFAIDSDPRSIRPALLQPLLVRQNGGELLIGFSHLFRPAAANGLSVIYQRSLDLQDWQPLPPAEYSLQTTQIDPQTQHRVLTFLTPPTQALFLRATFKP